MTTDKIELGYVEGDICNREACKGIIKEREVEGCTCHLNPPCSSCMEPRGYCDTCGWEDEE